VLNVSFVFRYGVECGAAEAGWQARQGILHFRLSFVIPSLSPCFIDDVDGDCVPVVGAICMLSGDGLIQFCDN
jgi:hypothetical protein